jgi:ribosomal protein S12 methylthiotransferase accessory factor
VAFTRAVTEAVQARLTGISGARDDFLPQRYAAMRDPAYLAAMTRAVVDGACPRSFSAAPDFEGETFEEDVAWLLERLRGAGVRQVVVVDLTKREICLPVVRVVIPGLECAAVFAGTFTLGRRALALQAAPA